MGLGGLCGTLWFSVVFVVSVSRVSGLWGFESEISGLRGLRACRDKEKIFSNALGRDFCGGKGLGVFKAGIFWVPDRSRARGGGRTNYHGMKAKGRYG